MATIEEILRLERIDRDIFRGAALKSVLTRTFGGQVACQSLLSAVRTVVDDYDVHSLHGYFIRPGDPDAPTVYTVERIRDGRSFCTRRVTAIQNGEAIFSMEASFQVPGQSGIEHQDPMPPAPDPEDLPDPLDDENNESLATLEWRNFHLRRVPQDQMQARTTVSSQQVWFRYRTALPDDQFVHIATLAYMSDMTLLGTSRVAHPDADPQFASLDHAMWFLRPFRADEWLLYDQGSPSAGGGRALTHGRIFNQAGDMVAAVVQEGLARTGSAPAKSAG